MSIKNGDLPAMPVKHDGVCSAGDGLSKRERFAMAAMQGLRSCTAEVYLASDLARHAVEYADALLAELEKSK